MQNKLLNRIIYLLTTLIVVTVMCAYAEYAVKANAKQVYNNHQ